MHDRHDGPDPVDDFIARQGDPDDYDCRGGAIVAALWCGASVVGLVLLWLGWDYLKLVNGH